MKLRVFTQAGSNLTASLFIAIGITVKLIFEAMGCYYLLCSCQETGPYLSGQDIKKENKRREMDELKRDFIKKKKNQECGIVSGVSVLKQILRS